MSVLSADVHLRRGAFALAARFEAPGDGVTALFGPSGAGKSVLLSALAGLKRLEAGRIALGARVLDAPDARVFIPPHLRGIGLIFQDARLLPHLTVRGNLDYAARRAPAGKPRPSLQEAAAQFDIEALMDRPIRHLSGGEKSRVALARALLSAPDFLLLDEPFAALDGVRRRAFLASLRAAHERYALPMLVVTHQIDDVAALADHVIGLRAGAVVAEGPSAQTLVSPAFQALLDARDIGAPVRTRDMTGLGEDRGIAAWVRADHVLIATQRPQGLSARNIWEVRVVRVTAEPDGAVLVEMAAALGAVFARITADASRDLALSEGAAVWAVVKAHTI